MSHSINRENRRGSRFALAIVATTLLVLTASASVAAASLDKPTSSGTTTVIPGGDGATRIYPNSNVRDLRKTPWDQITVSPNGRRLVVYFWMGVQACNGLGRVDVNRHDGQVDIQLWTGTPPKAIGMVCPELAQLYKTVIYLNRPIFGGNSL